MKIKGKIVQWKKLAWVSRIGLGSNESWIHIDDVSPAISLLFPLSTSSIFAEKPIAEDDSHTTIKLKHRNYGNIFLEEWMLCCEWSQLSILEDFPYFSCSTMQKWLKVFLFLFPPRKRDKGATRTTIVARKESIVESAAFRHLGQMPTPATTQTHDLQYPQLPKRRTNNSSFHKKRELLYLARKKLSVSVHTAERHDKYAPDLKTLQLKKMPGFSFSRQQLILYSRLSVCHMLTWP